MTGRDAFLGRIRQALAPREAEASRRTAVAARLGQPPRGPVPARGQLPDAERRALLAQKATAAYATVATVGGPEDVPAAVATFLRDNNLPALIRRGNDPRLAALPWASAPQLTVAVGPSDGSDPTGLSHAEVGIAETGTLVLASGPDNPTTLNFLPETHVVVLDGATVVAGMEDAWALLRSGHAGALLPPRPGPLLPRTVNLVTGPSRSADIEQTLLLGAHGPRRLHIILIEPRRD